MLFRGKMIRSTGVFKYRTCSPMIREGDALVEVC